MHAPYTRHRVVSTGASASAPSDPAPALEPPAVPIGGVPAPCCAPFTGLHGLTPLPPPDLTGASPSAIETLRYARQVVGTACAIRDAAGGYPGRGVGHRDLPCLVVEGGKTTGGETRTDEREQNLSSASSSPTLGLRTWARRGERRTYPKPGRGDSKATIAPSFTELHHRTQLLAQIFTIGSPIRC